MRGVVRRPWRFVATAVGATVRRRRNEPDPEIELDRVIAEALAAHESARTDVAEAVTRQQRSSIRLHARLAAAERAADHERGARVEQVLALLDEVIEDTFQVHDRRDHLARISVDLRERIIAAAAAVDESAQVDRRDQLTDVMRVLSSAAPGSLGYVGDDVPLPAHLDERIRTRLAILDGPD